MSKTIYSLLILMLCSSCSSDTPEPTPIPTPAETIYFPPLTGTTWDTKIHCEFRLETIRRTTAIGLFGTQKFKIFRPSCQRKNRNGKLF